MPNESTVTCRKDRVVLQPEEFGVVLVRTGHQPLDAEIRDFLLELAIATRSPGRESMAE